MLKLGWFSTGRGPGSRGLLQFIQQRIERGLLDVSISFVFCNRERGEAEGSDTFFRLVDDYRLPLVTLSSRRFAREKGGRFVQCRSAYDLSVRDLLQGYDVGRLHAGGIHAHRGAGTVGTLAHAEPAPCPAPTVPRAHGRMSSGN